MCASPGNGDEGTWPREHGNFSSGALVFNRDMFLDIPIIADILTLQQYRQTKINHRLMKANSKQIRHEFKVDDLIYIHNRHNAANKMKPIYAGRFPILQVHTNNTVTVRRKRNIVERITIRRLKPSKRRVDQR